MAAASPTPSHRAGTPARRLIASVAALACAAVMAPTAAGAREEPAADTTATQAAPESASTAALPSTLSVDGHGWGHGRGMGQYGSLGYATGWSGGPWHYATILSHFYGGTSVGHINDNPLMAVLLKSRGGQAMVVYREAGLTVPGVAGNPRSVRVTVRPDGAFDIRTGTTCLDTSTSPNPVTQATSPVRIEPAPDSGTTALRLCSGDGSAIAYRGELVAFAGSVRPNITMETVNLVHMDELMRGVVPRESPASWGDAAGGQGMNALRAQAVAARSYAAAGDSRWGNLHSALGARATTCDDTFCQVYGGLASVSPSGAVTYRVDDRTDRAVAETAGEVRISSTGGVARTEFSSSTGGYTAGVTFPAVPDQGDAVSQNPNHHWTGSLERSAIEAKYGTGTLTDVRFDRNGLGSMGGRVDSVTFVGTNRSVTKTGNEVRRDFGLKSDWFDISVPPPPAVEPRSIDTACPSTIPRGAFSDVDPASVHARAIDCVAHHRIAEGTGAGRFSPLRNVTRGQMASFVARMILAAGGTLPTSFEDAFDDDDDSEHELNINRLAAAGIVKGDSEGNYNPNDPIDRAQLASILQRALLHLEVALPSSPPPAFSDDNGSVHENAIDQLAAEGVVTGTGPGTYQPRATAKRDQMASFIARALDLALSD